MFISVTFDFRDEQPVESGQNGVVLWPEQLPQVLAKNTGRV